MYKNPSQLAYAPNSGYAPTNGAIFASRDPGLNDVYYPLGQFWINQAGLRLFYLVSQSNLSSPNNPTGLLQSTWEIISVGDVLSTISDTSNNPVSASSASAVPPDNIQLIGGTGISVVSDPSTNSLTITNTSPSEAGITINGDTGSITGSTLTIYTNNSGINSGSSVRFTNSGTVSTLNVTDASNNTMIGLLAGNLALSGNSNTGIGFSVLNDLSSGINNSSLGYGSLSKLSTGSFNCSFGTLCANLLTSGSNNCSMGNQTLSQLLTGSNNIIFGFQAGHNYTSSESNNIIIGSTGIIADANTIRIGTQGTSAGQQNSCFIAGIAGVVNSNINLVTINTASGQLGSQMLGGISSTTSSSTPLNTSEGIIAGGNAVNGGTAVIPANSLQIGTTLRFIAYGTCTSTVASNTQTFRIRMGNAGTIADPSIGFATVSSAASGTTIGFSVEVIFTVQTIGTTGTIAGSLTVINTGNTGISTNATNVIPLTVTATLNTTITNYIEMTYLSSAITTTCTFSNGIVEIVKS